jgi:predicted polyphosphate/ATP-dependent NAD kinase
MYSAVFAVNPMAAADIVKQLPNIKFKDSEVVDVDEEQIEQAFGRFKILADKKSEVFDEDMEAIVAETAIRAADKYRLIGLTVVCGTAATPTA